VDVVVGESRQRRGPAVDQHLGLVGIDGAQHFARHALQLAFAQ
jgi:hypothetical protein